MAPTGSRQTRIAVAVPGPNGPGGVCVHMSDPPSGSNEPSLIDAGALQAGPAAMTTSRQRATGGLLTVTVTQSTMLPVPPGSSATAVAQISCEPEASASTVVIQTMLALPFRGSGGAIAMIGAGLPSTV